MTYPNANGSESILNRKQHSEFTSVESEMSSTEKFQPEIRWPDLFAQIFLHMGALYGLLFRFYTIDWMTILWCKYTYDSLALFWLFPLSHSQELSDLDSFSYIQSDIKV